MRTLLVLAIVALSGCGSPAELAEPLPWHGRDLSQPGWQNVTLPGHTILEADYTLGKGQMLEYDWVVPSQWGIQFEIHRHDGQAVSYANQSFGAADEGIYRAPADGIHSIAWTNQNVEAVDLWFRVPPWEPGRAYLAPYDDGHNH